MSRLPMYERKLPSKTDEPEPGDEQLGWSRDRLIEMDTAFAAAMTKALAKEHKKKR